MSSEQKDSTKSTRLFAESEYEDLERDREAEEWIESEISKNSGFKAYIFKCLYKLYINANLRKIWNRLVFWPYFNLIPFILNILCANSIGVIFHSRIKYIY